MKSVLAPCLLLAASTDFRWLGFGCFVVLVLAVGVGFFVKGLTLVQVGAVGVVIRLGRRTGEIQPEGWVWLFPFINHIETIYVRERQIDITKAEYYTSDRVRIVFKTTLRVSVSDAAALFDQGPSTYAPFTRDSDDEEGNVAFRGLVKNSIRESVRSLNIRDVMFGGSHGSLRDRIVQELSQTATRWGLRVVEVWLTGVEADDEDMRHAVQSEVRESMAGSGELAAHEAQVRKGTLFNKVAMDMVRDAHEQLGQELSVDEATQFLMGFYQTQGALEVAMRSAEGQNDLLQLFYLQHLGVPVPQPRPLSPGIVTPPSLQGRARPAAPELVPADGSWVIGREGNIHLEWDGVSRHHARLDVAGGQMTLLDLGSTNGTFVNGQSLTPNVAVLISPGDTIRLGQSVSVSVEQLITATQTRRIDAGRETGVDDG